MCPAGVYPVCTFMLWYLSDSRTLSTSSHTPCSSSSCGQDKAEPCLTTEQRAGPRTGQPPSEQGALRRQDPRDLHTETVPQSF